MNSRTSLLSVASATEFKSKVLEPSHQTLVLVDFWAGWCGPCKALAPVIEEIAEANSQRLSVVKVDVDAVPSLASEYGVRALPTLALFKAGKLHSQLVGLQSAPAIEAMMTAAEAVAA